MEIQKELIPELYSAIRTHYESGSYSNAIIDAMKALTELIRTKSKIDNDGANLVGQAFGGNSPLIKISPMQKISEIDEQRGFEQLMRGLYTGIRNPRTHENIKDKKDECNAIIIFINYIFKRVSETKSFFELDEFKKRIFDPLFVEKAEYAEILVGEIPNDELVNTTITILHERGTGDPNKLQYFFESVFNKADTEQQQSIIKVFSNELKKATTDVEIIGLIRFIKPKLWPLIDDDTKLRIENRIIASVKEGYYDSGTVKKGALGTWGNSLGQYFKLRRDLSSAIIQLLSDSWYTQNYIAVYYLSYLESIIEGDYLVEKCCENLAYAVLGNNARHLKAELARYFMALPKKWRELFLEKGLRYRDKDKHYYDNLSAMKEEDEIPF